MNEEEIINYMKTHCLVCDGKFSEVSECACCAIDPDDPLSWPVHKVCQEEGGLRPWWESAGRWAIRALRAADRGD